MIDKLKEVIDDLQYIATSYAEFFDGYVFMGPITIDHDCKIFSFYAQPRDSGIGIPLALPTSLLLEDVEELLLFKLSGMAEKQKKEWEEERKNRTCTECWHIKLPSYMNIAHTGMRLWNH